MSAVKRFVLWDFPRAGWQYDVMVGLILAFIFFTPREVFRDQPKPSSIVILPSEHGATLFWMDAEQFASVPPDQQAAQASNLLKARTGKKYKVVRVEPIIDAERELKVYMAFTTP